MTTHKLARLLVLCSTMFFATANAAMAQEKTKSKGAPVRAASAAPARPVARAPRTQAAPICNPVDGSTGRLNRADARRGQGSGQFGSARDGGRTHKGIDIQGRAGTPVRATDAGKVVHSAKGKGGAGNAVVVQSKSGKQSYFHLQGDRQPKVGSTVKQGERVGTLGRTGNVPTKADSHLHYERRDTKGGLVRPEVGAQSCREVRTPPAPRAAPAGKASGARKGAMVGK